MNPRETTRQILNEALRFYLESPWKERFVPQIEALLGQVDTPCVLAVAGRVKAGKSTLINALLGENLAKVGVTETTATINYFRYGTPEEAARPVCCRWQDGTVSWESKAFLDGLQGTDEAVIKQAERIAALDFYVPHPDLQDITLVDTPGTDAIVGSSGAGHEKEVERFFQLRKRHEEETRQLTEKADAVIYLVGQVAHMTNRDFLKEFTESSTRRTSALNAVGVMSKIDLDEGVLADPLPLARSISEKLAGQLHQVLPVSAGLWSGIQTLKSSERWEALHALVRRIPKERLDDMLTREQAFLREYKDCPVGVEERRSIKQDIPWRVFVIICQAFAEKGLEDAGARLEEQSGMPALHRMVHEHFIRRARVLRCYRILFDMRNFLGDTLRQELHAYRNRVEQNRRDLNEFTDFVNEHPKTTSETAGKLRRYLQDSMPVDGSESLEHQGQLLLHRVEKILDDFEQASEAFHALRCVEACDEQGLSEEERNELMSLFQAMDGGDSKTHDHAGERQAYWHRVRAQSRHENRRAVAMLAERAYGRLI